MNSDMQIAYKKPKYIPNKVIAVDCDGTIIDKYGRPKQQTIDNCIKKKAMGFMLILWSARGQAYAESVADKLNISYLFEIIIGKPGYIIDNDGWGWIKYTRVIKP